MVGVWRILTVMRMLNVDLKYRKCESKYEKSSYIILVQLMFWCYENGIGNLAVAYASERYDV